MFYFIKTILLKYNLVQPGAEGVGSILAFEVLRCHCLVPRGRAMSVPWPPSLDGVLTGPPDSLEVRELMPDRTNLYY